MEFTYILPGWEASAADIRVRKDALSRTHPIKVPRGEDTAYFNLISIDLRLIMHFLSGHFLGTYYLVDAGYTNREGFLA